MQCKFLLLIKTVSLDLNDKVGECFVDGCLWFSISLIDSEHIYIYIVCNLVGGCSCARNNNGSKDIYFFQDLWLS